MNELALFSGIGGGILGSVLLGHRVVCAVELDPYCREVLLRRQEEQILPPFPIWDDIRTFDGKPWRGKLDIVSAGFPCQPYSVAGKRVGKDDERNLWPDTIRVIREVGPRYALLENVPGIMVHDYFGEILGDLAEAGYDAQWDIISAYELGAPHMRKRIWIVANAECAEWRKESEGRNVANGENLGREETASGVRECGAYVADSPKFAEREPADETDAKPVGRETRQLSRGGSWWLSEPDVGRLAHGISFRLDRLRAIRNAQVPAVAREAWVRLTPAERKRLDEREKKA